MAKIQDSIKAKVVEAVAHTLEDALQSRYSDSNDRLKSALFNIDEPILTEVVCAGRDCMVDETKLARLILLE